jgi:GR25 family glycosyltransferase involved in LPS biosynthesis
MDRILINIITLQEHCKDRVVAMVEEMKRISFVKWRFEEGIYGKNIEFDGTIFGDIQRMTYSYRNFTDTRFFDKRRRLTLKDKNVGELGAAWSHINLYKKLLDDKNYDFYLILEDDTIILDCDYLKELIENLPSEFDLVHLATSKWNEFVKMDMVNKNFHTIKKDYFNCAAAYIVSKTGAQKLLNYTYDAVFCPPDDLLSNTFLFSNNFRVVIPDKPVFGMGENNEISVVNTMSIE